MIKKILSSVFCALIASFYVASAQEFEYMNIYSSDETSANSIHLDEIDRITLDADAMVVTLNNNNEQTYVDFLYNDISYLTFGDKVGGVITSVDAIENELNIPVSITYNQSLKAIEINASSSIKTISVYNQQGMLMFQASPDNVFTSIQLSDYTAGVYIVNVVTVDTVAIQKILKH